MRLALRQHLSEGFNHLWYQPNWLAYALVPFSWLFQVISVCRASYYRLRGAESFPVPVIVVGNLTVGGTGKTPLVAALAQFLREAGHRPGIVMRGYQSHFTGTALAVSPTSDPWEAGEEAVLLAEKTDCPVMIGRKRVEVIKALLAANPEVDVILSDDGLQHYAMTRDMEIVVIDEKRSWGNGFCLPAGPLREPKRRLRSVDYALSVQKQLSDVMFSVNPLSQQAHLTDFVGKKVHAVAGIGNPELFFAQLRAKGLDIIPHAFPDHYWYAAEDLAFGDDYPIIMTEKDAIKCRQLIVESLWCVPLLIAIPEALKNKLLRRIATWTKSSSRSWRAQYANNL